MQGDYRKKKLYDMWDPSYHTVKKGVPVGMWLFYFMGSIIR